MSGFLEALALVFIGTGFLALIWCIVAGFRERYGD